MVRFLKNNFIFKYWKLLTQNNRRTRIPRWLVRENEEYVARTRNCCGWPSPSSESGNLKSLSYFLTFFCLNWWIFKNNKCRNFCGRNIYNFEYQPAINLPWDHASCLTTVWLDRFRRFNVYRFKQTDSASKVYIFIDRRYMIKTMIMFPHKKKILKVIAQCFLDRFCAISFKSPPQKKYKKITWNIFQITWHKRINIFNHLSISFDYIFFLRQGYI